MTFTPASLPNSSGTLIAHWCARLESYNDDDLIDTLNAQSGTSFDATQSTDANKPTFKTNIMNGYPVARFDGNDWLIAGSASDWKFMHDGTDVSIFVIFATTSDNPGALMMFLDTSGTSSANIGSAFWIDDNNGENRIRYQIAKGVSGNPIVDFHSGDYGFASESEMTLGSAIYDNGAAGNDAKIYSSGAFTNSTDTINLPHSAADPTNTLYIGALSTTQGFPLTGDIAEILIYSGALDETDRVYVETNLLSLYGRVIPTRFTKLEPTVRDVDGLGIAMYSEDHQIIYIGRAGPKHNVDNNTDLVMWNTPNGGGSWNNQVLYNEAGSGIRNFGGGKASTNTLVVAVGYYDMSGSAWKAIKAIRSTDNGASWNDVGQLPTGSATIFSPYGNLVELPSGSTGVITYNWDGTNACTNIIYSDDDGLTWSAGSQLIISEAEATSKVSEMSIVTIAGETDATTSMIAITRDDIGNLKQITSKTGGATWEVSGSMPFSSGIGTDVSPWLHTDNNGTTYLLYTDRTASKNKMAWGSASDIIDDITAWNGPNVFYASNYGTRAQFGYPSINSTQAYGNQTHIMFHDTAGSGTNSARLYFSSLSALSRNINRRLIITDG
jgi:hypothetical protein